MTMKKTWTKLDSEFKEALRDLRHLALEEGAENSKAEELSFKVEEAYRACIAWDAEDMDGTDGAHPAWWRGSDHGVARTCQLLSQYWTGEKDDPCHGYAPLNELARKLIWHRAVIASFADEVQRAVDANDRKNKGGQQVPFHGDFANAMPSVLHKLQWWVKRLRGK